MAYRAGNRIVADQFRASAKLLRGDIGKNTFEITGLDKINKRLAQLARWSVEQENQIVSLNRRVAQVYLNALNANIKDYKRDIRVQFKDRDDIIVKRGQLRRSLGSWQPAAYDPTKILAGPITGNIGRRRKRGVKMANGRKTYTRVSDGWFAHIVEGGDSFGIKKTTPNTGVFRMQKAATQNRAMKLRDRLLRKQFSKFLGNLLQS